MPFIGINTELYGKINIQLNNNYPLQGLGELGLDPAERTAESAADP